MSKCTAPTKVSGFGGRWRPLLQRCRTAYAANADAASTMAMWRPARQKVSGFGGGVALCLLISASPAHAQLCDACVVAAIQEHKATMVGEFGQLRSHLSNEFHALKEHISREITTVRQSIAQVEKDSLRVQQDIDHILPSGGCETATTGSSAGPARDRVESYRRAYNHLLREERTGSDAASAMYAQHIAHYCTAAEIGTRGCQVEGERPSAPYLLETLLSGSGTGDAVNNDSITRFLPEVLSFDTDRITDARRFIDAAVAPYPLDDLPEDLQNTPQGQALWIKKKLYDQKVGFARHSMNHALALRTPAAGLRGWLEDVWGEAKNDEHVQALLDALPENISYLELLKTEVDRRYATPSWYAGIASNPPSALLRELAHIGALQLNLDFQRLRQNERLEMLLARLVVAQSRDDRVALQAEIAAAQRVETPGSHTPPTATRQRTSRPATPADATGSDVGLPVLPSG